MKRYKVDYTGRARAQLLDLYRYIAGEADPHVALAFVRRIENQCERSTFFRCVGRPATI